MPDLLPAGIEVRRLDDERLHFGPALPSDKPARYDLGVVLEDKQRVTQLRLVTQATLTLDTLHRQDIEIGRAHV